MVTKDVRLGYEMRERDTGVGLWLQRGTPKTKRITARMSIKKTSLRNAVRKAVEPRKLKFIWSTARIGFKETTLRNAVRKPVRPRKVMKISRNARMGKKTSSETKEV